MTKKQNNAGFSLIEMMIVIAIMAVMSGALFLGPGVFRRKEIDQYSKELCNQITQMRTLSMAKAGQWRLAFYESDGNYYCVQEKKETDQGTGVSTWIVMSGQTELGHSGAVLYKQIGGGEAGGGDNPEGDVPEAKTDTPLFVWRFNRDTGACAEGAGTYELSGYNKVKQIKVYAGSGRCEEVPLP